MLFGNLECIEFFFKYLVFIDYKDVDGMMLFFCLVVVGYINCVKLFFEFGVDIVVCDKY